MADTKMTMLGWGATKNSGSTLSNSTCIGYRAWRTASNQFMLGNNSVTNWVLGGGQYSLMPDAVTRLGSSALLLQSTASANSPTYWALAPNGTGNTSGVRLYNASDPNNTGAVTFSIAGSVAGISPSSFGTGTAPTSFQLSTMTLQLTSVNVAQLPTCGGPQEGTIQPVKDSANTTFAGPLTGGGTYHVLAYCTGSGWSVH